MAKSPEINIALDRLEDILLKANPFSTIIPLRVRMSFNDLPEEEVKDLEEFANVENGALERWLLVPDCIPLASLSYVIEKAFGLLPDPSSNAFTMEEEDWNRLFPTMGTFLKECGRLLDNPMDANYISTMAEASISSNLWIAPLPIAMLVPTGLSYKDAQKEINKQFAALRSSGVDLNGSHYTLEDAPVDLEYFFDKVEKPDELALTDSLCPDLELREVLQVEGHKLYGLKDQRKAKRNLNAYERRKAKPFLHKLHMLKFDEEDYVSFDFEITRPKDIYSLIKDGYLEAEDYLESIKYVLTTMMPDCICKKGYDLFGPDQEFYHEFIMEIHGKDAGNYLPEAMSAGWKEPYMDLKKVLREEHL